MAVDLPFIHSRLERQMVKSDSSRPPDSKQIRALLKTHRVKMKLNLKVCAHCGLCAESCFLFSSREKTPIYMPSHKFIHSIGLLYRKNGRVSHTELQQISEIVFRRCVLCMRCYCPIGINIPEMIGLARRICRSQGMFRSYDTDDND
jgi:succinate dehydrogenase/fumarate reductase-like Fe-S protein